MDNSELLVSLDEGVMSIVLNRPGSLNALTPNMVKDLLEAIERARQDQAIRAIVLSGAGRAFCSGGDVKNMGTVLPPEAFDRTGRMNNVILGLQNLDIPVIAAVHGYAAGVGASLAMACDLIFAAEDSKLLFSFSRIGLICDGGGHYFLARALGAYRAKEILFNAEPVNARKAMEWGIVNQVFPEEQVKSEALAYAAKLAKGPRRAYGLMKKIVNEALHSDLKTIIQYEQAVQAMMRMTADHYEGVQAFKEKRKPIFTGE